MKKVFLLIGFVALAGCGHVTQEEAQKEQVGYLGALKGANDTARTGIDEAVDTKNAQLENALAVLEEDLTEGAIEETNKETTTMETEITEEGIDMAFAKNCGGATITTNVGVVEVVFDANKAPKAVANFCTLADKGYYEGIIFHRVIKDFMIQGGDPTGTGTSGPGYKFEDELPQAGEYKIGSLAMANAGPDTNGSQFFIVSGEAGVGLPPLYTLFGQVTEGFDIVDTIQNTQTGPGDKPVSDVIIEKIELVIK